MSGGILFDCLSGQEPASSWYFWRSGKLTNQLCTLGLGLFQWVGLSPRLAEGLWQLLLLALLLWTWKRMQARIEASPGAALLLLLPFMGQVLHMGFYNFLAGVHLGILAWTFRRPGWKNPRSDLLFLLALYAHPLGAASYLGLCAFDAFWQRSLTDLASLLPHALLFAWVSSGNTGGKMGGAPTDWPDIFGRTWIPYKEDALFSQSQVLILILGLVLLGVLLVGLSRTWSELSRSARKRRLALLVAAALPMLASGFSPDMYGAATHLRIRAAYLAWVLLLLALAPGTRTSIRLLTWARQGLILLLVLFNFAADRTLAQELQSFLDSMPKPAERATVLAGYDLYQAEVWPLGERLLPSEEIQIRHNSILDLQSRLAFDPWQHILDRWAHEEGALSLNDHQALYAHSPLGHRKPPSMSWREGIDYKCSQLPLDELVGAADFILLAYLEPDWIDSATERIPKGLVPVEKGPDWILFAGGGDPTPPARMATPFFSRPLVRWPVPWPIAAQLQDRRVQVAEPYAALDAWFPFQAFVLDFAGKSFRRARPDEIQPTEGIYDARGGFRFEHLERPTRGQLFLLPR